MSWLENVAVRSTEGQEADGLKISQRLQVPLLSDSEETTRRWIFFYANDELYLQDQQRPNYKPIYVDFLSKEFEHRCKSANRSDLLLKAIGLKKGVKTLFDATCGFGYDCTFINSLTDMVVTTCEKNIVVAELVIDGWRRLRDTGHFDHAPPFYFQLQSSIEHLNCTSEEYDTIYLDPMFPVDPKASAKPKSEIEFLRDLAGVDVDSAELFALALTKARRRVVVKRADDGVGIKTERNADFSIDGKSVRYDIYMIS